MLHTEPVNGVTIYNSNTPNEMVPSEIIYAEMNLEKWPIWEPSSTYKILRPRSFERERVLSDGSRVTARVQVGSTEHGTLSTRDQKIYYVLLKLWNDAGRPETPVSFSLQKIARVLGEDWGMNVRRSIAKSLVQLRGVLFVWENSYFDKTTGEHLELLDTFNILSELTIARRTKKLHATTEACVFQFHRQLLASLHNNHTTPLFLDTVLGFRSEIAQLLYPRLDLLLADKNHYERRTKELFEDMGVRGETYRHRSARKRVIERALREIEGVPITTGRIISATVEPTKDNLDFKIVIHKGPLRRAGRPRKVLGPAHEPAQHTLQPSAEEASRASRRLTSPLTREAEPDVLVRYFHSVFHDAPPASLSSKDLAQAARLIERHGLVKAKALIDLAKCEAPKTKYSPASLNGILHYEGRFEALCLIQEQATDERLKRQSQVQHARAAQHEQSSHITAALMEQVAVVRERAPKAFAAFVSDIEAERDKFLQTPIARKAKPETRELLSREYERPARRLEMFLDFFQPGGVGESLLGAQPQTQAVALWLRDHRDAVQKILRADGLDIDASQLVS